MTSMLSTQRDVDGKFCGQSPVEEGNEGQERLEGASKRRRRASACGSNRNGKKAHGRR
jgi:hypothetical protein